MNENEKTAREEFIEILKNKARELWNFLMPNSEDPLILKIFKSICKIPVALFIALLSPILFLILAVVFVIMI